MARLAFGGFETRHASADGFTIAGGAPVSDTGVAHSGAASLKCPAATDGTLHCVSYPISGATQGRTYHARTWIRLGASPGSDMTVMRLGNASNIVNNYGSVIIDSSRRVVGADGTLSSALATNTWYCLELEWVANGTTVTRQVRLNGSNLGSTGSVSTGATPSWLGLGVVYNNVASTPDVWLDDWAINDDQGSANTSWCGTDGQVIALLPASDNAVGSNWKLGDGTSPSSNAYDSVNNTPSIGAADPSAAGAQIKNAVGSTTQPAAAADFNMQSYTTAGVPSGSTIVAAHVRTTLATDFPGLVYAAAQVVSNPTISDKTIDTTGSGGSPGTYPTNWKAFAGNMADSPTVTLGTQPVVRLRRADTQSNTLWCSQLVLYVEYSAPAAQTVSPSGIASGAAIGSATVTTGPVTVSPSGVASAAAMGTPTVVAGQSIVPTGIASGQAFGTANVHGVQTISPTAISGLEAFGTPLIESQVFLSGSVAAQAAGDGWLNYIFPPRIPSTFWDKWRTGQHIGANRPGMLVQIRPGEMKRAYSFWPEWGDDDSRRLTATVGATSSRYPWQATWTPSGPYVDVPNVLSCELAKSFESNGIQTATLTIENIAYSAEDGGHHAIHRGYLAPLRGYVAAGQTRLVDEHGQPVYENEWFEILNRNCQITVWQLYGDQAVKTFTGLVDDVDLTSRPDRITVTARDFGQLLSDERIFGWNKDPDILDPIIFIDRDQADDIKKIGYDPSASTEADDYPATNVADSDSDTMWHSHNHTSAGNTEWVQVRLTQGRYNDYLLFPQYDGMEIYVSINPKTWTDSDGVEHSPHRNGVDIPENEWVDTGQGTVPGANGGIPYVLHVTDLSARALVRQLDADYMLGDDSILRIHFRSLAEPAHDGNFRAGVRTLYGRRRQLSAEAKKQKWILVDDISDVVKVILRWAGFKEWEVESAGVPLPKRLIYNRGSTYIDAIKQVADAIGYVFFIADPTNWDGSMGVPTFRQSLVVREGVTPVATVRDSDLLTAISVKQTDEPLSYIIRVRGREDKDEGVILSGEPPTKRIMFTFRTPWRVRLGRILKHVVHVNNLFTSLDDCKFGAYYIALQEALESIKASIEFPAYPGFDLDDHAGLLDLGTGLTTRLSIAERRSTFTAGEKTKWTMTLGGTLIDTPDVQDIVTIIRDAVRST